MPSGLIALVAIAVFAASTFADENMARIGILGDIHGEKDNAVKVLRQMRQSGVTHLIGTGDFIAGRIEKLTDLLPNMSESERVQLLVQMGQPDLALVSNEVLPNADKQLESVLALLSAESGVPKDRIYLFPGNWEHEVGFAPEVMNSILAQFGQSPSRFTIKKAII